MYVNVSNTSATLPLLSSFALSLFIVFVAVGERPDLCENKHKHKNKLRDQNP